jgi:hypothetical protein
VPSPFHRQPSKNSEPTRPLRFGVQLHTAAYSWSSMWLAVCCFFLWCEIVSGVHRLSKPEHACCCNETRQCKSLGARMLPPLSSPGRFVTLTKPPNIDSSHSNTITRLVTLCTIHSRSERVSAKLIVSCF